MDKERQLDDFFGLENPSDEDSKNRSKKEGIKETILKKSFKSKLRLLPKVLSKKERYLILVFIIVIICSAVAIPIASYYHYTQPMPAFGGSVSEGIIGELRYINPLLAQSDADRDLVRLIYSGLLKYNKEGKLVPDLAKSYDISSDELNYTFYLKDNVKWHDGSALTANDVMFTVQTVKNPDYGSFHRINWQGVEIERVDDHTVVFKLKNKYAQFLNNLTLPILPQHVWEDSKPINFTLSEANIKPIGSGPYKFKKFQKDQTGRIRVYELVANKGYYDQTPNIETLKLRFYVSEDELINAYNKNEVESLGLISSKNLEKVKFKQRLSIQKLKMPRYFGIFFNQNQSKILSDKNIRLALTHAINKKDLIEKILQNNGISINSPMLSSILDINGDIKTYEHDKNLAGELLDKAGWDKKDENGVRIKNNEKLSLKLTTSTWSELVEISNLIKDQWKEVGVELQMEILPTSELQSVIRERNYQMLLFGEILNPDPDPFSLWHSSQKRDPGLNLALYDNKAADKLLEEARQTLNPNDRMRRYDEFQKLVIEEAPAIFLYSPYYLYGQAKKIKGFNNELIATPAERFANIQDWYIETRRVWK